MTGIQRVSGSLGAVYLPHVAPREVDNRILVYDSSYNILSYR